VLPHERLRLRRWRDLPMGTHAVEYAPRRVFCTECNNAVVEQIAWTDRHQRQTPRLQQMVALEALSMPVVHVAAKHSLRWNTVRRIEFQALAGGTRTRECSSPPRQDRREVSRSKDPRLRHQS
jgi:transposase